MAERELVSIFAILLVVGSVLLLFSPIFYRLMRTGLWTLTFVMAAPVLLLAALGLSFVEYSLTDPIYLAPVVAVVFGARVVSPTLAFLKIRERTVATNGRALTRLLLFIAFLVFGLYVGYKTFVDPSGASIDPILISEKLIMTLGTALVFLRLHLMIMPKGSYSMKVVWVAAFLFSLAFAVVAPYAFPAYGVLYGFSGVMGWLIGGAVILKSK
ncbi:MAG: hypothetical protein LN412_03000 [Candidatus Thermoplasmatota archaeon]|nr:hypothetical protein [Candidatus Thermoplasmatota archaeon]